MPSHHEQWGLAIQEMALLGYPLVLSSACGAGTEFLISGYNGYMFRTRDVDSLTRALSRFSLLNESELAEFGRNSRRLGGRISTEQAAYSLLSALPMAEM